MLFCPIQMKFFQLATGIVPTALWAPPFICPHGLDHQPRLWRKRNSFKEWFYEAAKQGCLSCIRHCVEVLHVDTGVKSDNAGFTALDWSRWVASDQSNFYRNIMGADQVCTYLSNNEFKRRPLLRHDPTQDRFCMVLVQCAAQTESVISPGHVIDGLP